jgi:DHA2 family multidrug resistance protein
MSATATFPGALAPARPATNKWLVTISVTFGTLMGAIDASIVNVALPHMRGAVGATLQEITWVSTGFAIATVIVMPLTAFLGRLFGQKRVYMASLLLFVASSALCGMAWSLPSLVLFRVLQGFGAGALQPTEQAILRQTFPPEEQGLAMALFAMAVMIGPAVGPTLGGWIVDNVHWSWIFFINLPVGALGLFMVGSFVHEPDDIRAANAAAAARQRKNMDWLGIALLAVGLAALQFFLEEGQQKDWFQSSLIVGCAAVAVAALALFVWRELAAPVPAVNLRLFKDPLFASGTLIGAVMFAILLASMFLLPVFMQELLGFTAMQSGLALMPRTLVMMAVTPIVGRIYGKVSPRLLVAAGITCVALGAFDVSQVTLQSTARGIVDAILIQGVGFSLLFVPLTTAALSQIPRTKLADATGLNSLLRQVGASMGLALFATILSRHAVQAKAAIAAHVTLERPEVQARLGALVAGFQARGFGAVEAREAAVRVLDGTVTRQAMVLSFQHVLALTGVLFLCVLPLLIFLKVKKGPAGRPPHLEMET